MPKGTKVRPLIFVIPMTHYIDLNPKTLYVRTCKVQVNITTWLLDYEITHVSLFNIQSYIRYQTIILELYLVLDSVSI